MKPMAEKDNDSMATVQIKPEYAPSEVYSTASEPPPAYKRQSSSVKIAKITAFTIIVSSFIIGSFILASTYLQARVSCDQVQALDSVLEKELMLETLQQVNKELPRADALIGVDSNDEIDLQNLDKEEPTMVKKVEKPKTAAAPVPLPVDSRNNNNNEQTNNESETDSSFSDSEEADDLQKISNKVPLELDLSDLAAALLQNNKKSRMNCVVERKHAEEIVDSPSKTVNLPFGVNLTTDPKKARITGERISIFCESGNEDKEQQPRPNLREEVDDVEAIRPMFIPYQRVPIPFGQTPNQFPLTHMPQRMMPQRMNMMPPMPQQQQQPPMVRQMPPPFQHMPTMGGMRPPMPPQIMQAPHPEPMQEQHVRIHVQQLPFREIHVSDDMPIQIPSGNQELPHIQVQRVPLGLALQRAGITAEDLRNIQRAAEERITDELRRLAAEEAAESNSDSDSNSSEEDDSQTQSNEQMHNQEQQQQQQQQRQQEEEQLTTQQLPMEPRDTMTPPMPDQPQILQIGRNAYGRSLMSPVNIPIPMNQAQADMNQEAMESERPHYVQPRSIRSTDNIFKSEKRVKKCACDCNC
ncbi:putative uncharacterized protein DDB_G0291608 isoform X2 [Episyrphus balteatus]|uniref:putative uncharacterized protein DDB_G0291608 isoform X2 n=1 Tax=Episyrphus balteatus TaxID=286459 RepID=UPI0024866995|nr:putative uncharacterized protein DDB_G0291608 isoform X2 [Episyrphus balteatus]